MHTGAKMPGFKDRCRALVTSKSPSRAKSGVEASQASAQVEHSKVGDETNKGGTKHTEDLYHDPSEDRRLLRRSRTQLWVWRCLAYLLFAALIGEGLLA